MKKTFIGLLILVLSASAWAQYVFSAEPIQLARMNGYVAAGVGAASCSNGLTDTSYTEAATYGIIVTSTAMAGQSFEVSTPGMKIYSITIRTYAHEDITNETITIRYGTNLNLGGTCGVGNNCLKEVTTPALSWSAAETKNVEVIFQDTNALNTETPYYFMVHSSASADLAVLYVFPGEYGNGTSYSTSSDASDWDLTGHNDNSYDLYFVIKKCN